MIGRLVFRACWLLIGMLAAVGVVQAAPFLLSEKMPPSVDANGFSTQPQEFYVLAGDTRLTCTTTKVQSTGTVQMSCDLARLPPGSYPLTVVSVKTSNNTETRTPMGKLNYSGAYSCQKYLELRVCNVAYTVVKP